MPHFFISYAKKDTRELALQLNEALNALPNVTAWVDKSLKAGRSWELQIQTEIDRCDYMLVLYSPDINRHKQGVEESYMLSEIHYAKRIARKPIIPVMAQTTEPPMSLVMEQYIDFTRPGLRLGDLITAICDEANVGAGFIPPATPTPTKPISLSLMPAPFAWIDIPGKIGKTWGGAPYSIAKYPITNAQFEKFIEAGGYNQRRWWTDAGWEAKSKAWDSEAGQWIETNQPWTQPRYWTVVKQHRLEEHPVAWITWYEAVAYCLWLSEASGEKIMLPTKDQWLYAAQGDDGRDYPWGKKWDANRCNNNVDRKMIGGNTPVRQYEGKGDSFFGVVDMVGNVWEWCLTDDDSKSNDINSYANNRFLCGSSHTAFNPIVFRCVSGHGSRPYAENGDIGFRISRS
jgi:formylglycine-generating enzyme required for sulfatase activity